MFICCRDTSGDNDEDDDASFEQVRNFKGVAQSYELNFASGIRNLHPRMETAIQEAAKQLTQLQRNGRSLKYYVSLQCNFYKPSDPDTITNEPCSFNSGTSTLLPTSSIKTQMEINYISILQAVENFERNGSGKKFFTIVFSSLLMESSCVCVSQSVSKFCSLDFAASC